MEINSTIFGQMITFGIFIWFTMKFVWPGIESAMNEREKKIADGLAAAEKGHKTLEDAALQAKQEIDAARAKSHEILQNAHQSASEIVDEAKQQAVIERDNIIASGHEQLQKEVHFAKTHLQQQLVSIAIDGASQVLGRECVAKDHEKLVADLCKEL